MRIFVPTDNINHRRDRNDNLAAILLHDDGRITTVLRSGILDLHAHHTQQSLEYCLRDGPMTEVKEAPLPETFNRAEIIDAVEVFLDLGHRKAPNSYCDGSGWAARCLRRHLERLKEGKE